MTGGTRKTYSTDLTEMRKMTPPRPKSRRNHKTISLKRTSIENHEQKLSDGAYAGRVHIFRPAGRTPGPFWSPLPRSAMTASAAFWSRSTISG